MSHRSLQRMCSYYYDPSNRRAAIERHGSIASISSGVNQLPTPSIIRERICEEFHDDLFYRSYPRPSGSPLLLCSLLFEFHARLDKDLRRVVSTRNICVAVGGTGALNGCFDYLIRKQNVRSILVLGLNYSYYSLCCDKFNVDYRILLSAEPGRIMPTIAEAIEATNRERPDLVILTQPGNPSGEVYEEFELAVLTEFVDGQGAWMLIDQVPDMANPAEREVPQPSIVEKRTGQAGKLVVVNSFSKSRSLAGHRMGYVVAQEPLIDYLERYNEAMYWSPSNVASSALAIDVLLRVLSRKVGDTAPDDRRRVIQSTVRQFQHYLSIMVPYSEDYSEKETGFRDLIGAMDWDETLRHHELELQAIYQTYTANWQLCRDLLAPWTVREIEARHGFNHCVQLRTDLCEEEFCRRAFDKAGLDFYTECVFSDSDDMDRSPYWVRISTAINPKTFELGLSRLNRFLETAGRT